MFKKYLPAEWSSHFGCFLAYPFSKDLWENNLELVQKEFQDLCKAIHLGGDKVFLFTPMENSVHFGRYITEEIPCHYEDIWLRDTGCIFGKEYTEEGQKLIAWTFLFNGWGEKYHFPYDQKISQIMAQGLTSHIYAYPLVLEGGSIESNGAAVCLTSKQCLLNPNRNHGILQAQLEHTLMQAFEFEKILWVDEGLKNDHTDGHIDTIARFINPHTIACMAPVKNDPNEKVLKRIIEQCRSFTQIDGKPFQVVTVNSAGDIRSHDHQLLPASYLNFYITNTSVIVPLYGSVHDATALKTISQWFPERTTLGLSSLQILEGGGSFHCVTQQIPLLTYADA